MYGEIEIIAICAIPLVFVIVYFSWQDRREKEQKLEKRVKELEEAQKKRETTQP